MNSDQAKHRGVKQLAAVVLLVSLIWLLVLPAVTRLPAVQNRIARHESAGIDPTAFFYTDHDGLEEWVKEVENDLEGISKPLLGKTEAGGGLDRAPGRVFVAD
ncbi:hypothetical protein [Calycomorphotria hydatis]|uniref:Uncharacterized protein n=1 Tax=Calycomorphotria hydatis TaxID=2528027 RepID=A0A517T461_9PLAN|nr:hypothetical protein [Calycomorphotria hydatis]QDT63150.1 hypothetical protein V22_03680 [Calycomorphotria hydatis]